jgi:transcriptional regulator with XRE-family HTH domain
MPLLRRVNRLREIRINRGLSGYDLQLLSSVPAQEIYRIERGLKRPKKYEKNLIAEALAKSVEEIFPDSLQFNREILEA